jgi:enoyl-CoA hydratase
MTDKVLLCEKHPVANCANHFIEIWTLNRPDKLNAINSELITALMQEGTRLKQELNQDLRSCRVLILQGAGSKAFAAGADIVEMKNFGQKEAEVFSRNGQTAFGMLEELPCPTIASIDGFALGGGLELAMCCDILIASEKSQFGQPEAYLGLIPGFGATARFVERLGTAKALELLYSGARIKAQEAMQLGLLQHVVAESPLSKASELAYEISEKSGPQSVASIKKIVRQKTNSRWRSTLDLEAQTFGEIFESHDKKEGIAAFLEKRKACFTGK